MSVSNWFKSLTNPAKVFRKEKKKASLDTAISNAGFAGLVVGVVYALIGKTYGMDYTFVFLSLIIIIIALLIQSGILFAVAKIFGTKGDFTTQTYLISIPYAALILIQLVLDILSTVPYIGFISSLASLIFWIYYTPLTMALRVSNRYNMAKAALICVVSLTLTAMFIVGLSIGIGLWNMDVFKVGETSRTITGFGAVKPLSWGVASDGKIIITFIQGEGTYIMIPANNVTITCGDKTFALGPANNTNYVSGEAWQYSKKIATCGGPSGKAYHVGVNVSYIKTVAGFYENHTSIGIINGALE